MSVTRHMLVKIITNGLRAGRQSVVHVFPSFTLVKPKCRGDTQVSTITLAPQSSKSYLSEKGNLGGSTLLSLLGIFRGCHPALADCLAFSEEHQATRLSLQHKPFVRTPNRNNLFTMPLTNHPFLLPGGFRISASATPTSPTHLRTSWASQFAGAPLRVQAWTCGLPFPLGTLSPRKPREPTTWGASCPQPSRGRGDSQLLHLRHSVPWRNFVVEPSCKRKA